jgi:hypothetical protein
MTIFQLVRPVCQPGWYVDIAHKKNNVMDFFQYVQVAQLALQGSHDVYNPDVQLAWHNNLIKPLKWENDKVFYNQQPPSSYFLLIPLAFAPNYGVGYCLWGVLQSMAGLAAMYFLSSFGKLKGRDRKIFLLAVFCSFPAFNCLWQGNTSFWLLSCLGFYAYFLLKGRDLVGGLFLALSTFKPQYTLMLSIPSLISGRWKLIAAAAVTELLLLAAGGMIIGFENVFNYPHVIANAESNPRFIGVRPEAMVSLRGILSHLGMGIHDSLSLSSTLMILSLVPVGIFWRLVNGKIATASLELKCWALAMTLVVALTLSPHSHVFDCVLLAFPAVLTLPTLSLVDALKIKERSLRCWSVIFIVYPILSWILDYSMPLMTSPMFFFLINLILLISGSIYTFGLMRAGKAEAPG